ncbi:MAG: Rid family hydrolase [Candidatus Dormiibacterota bacterium]
MARQGKKHPIEVTTTGAPRPIGAYSQGLVAAGLVFTAGEGPNDPVTGRTPRGIGAQTLQAILNTKAVLEAAGSGLEYVVKVTAHLADLTDFDAFNAAYAPYFPDPKPVRTTVGSDLLGGILVELDTIAVLPGD